MRKVIFAIILSILVIPSHGFAGPKKVHGTCDAPLSSNGSISRKVEYRITANKIKGTQKVKFRVEVRGAKPWHGGFSFAACAMLQTSKEDISMPQFVIKKERQSFKCEQQASNVNRPPSWHFGCRQITVNSSTKYVTVFNVVSDDLGQDFNQSELRSVYWDLLPDLCVPPRTISNQRNPGEDSKPINLCPNMASVNNNLSPTTGAAIFGSVNIWGANGVLRGGTCGELLSRAEHSDKSYCSSSRIEPGNWWTMGSGQSFATTLSGSVVGGPPNGVMAIHFSKDDLRQFDLDAAGAADISESLMITPESERAENDMYITFLSPEAPMEGTDFRFEGAVHADGENAFYEDLQYMYGISSYHVQDTYPPKIESVQIERNGDAYDVRVTAADQTGWPQSAEIVLLAEGASLSSIILTGDEDLDDNGARMFLDTVKLTPEAVSAYAIVTDETGNSARSEPVAIPAN